MSSHIYGRFIRTLDLKSLLEAIRRARVATSSAEAKPAVLNDEDGPMSLFLAARRDPIKMLDLLGFRKTERAEEHLQPDLASRNEEGGRSSKSRVPIPSIIAERIARLARRGR